MPTVFFLSDYGTEDEFVGVVHAVLAAASPGLTIIDLTHHVPAFDVRAGSHTLVRASPHLGPGVVLAVVDPGVGSERRGSVPTGDASRAAGPTFFVGPDNGLLIAAAELVGEAPIARAVRAPSPGRRWPTVAAASTGATSSPPPPRRSVPGWHPRSWVTRSTRCSLVRLPGGVVEQGRRSDGRRCLRAEVLWIDHFGNIQLAATAADAQMAELPRSRDRRRRPRRRLIRSRARTVAPGRDLRRARARRARPPPRCQRAPRRGGR